LFGAAVAAIARCKNDGIADIPIIAIPPPFKNTRRVIFMPAPSQRIENAPDQKPGSTHQY
jgi:hypothetical protein